MSDLRVMQQEVTTWSEENFGKQDAMNPYMGMVEELGELSHALLKQKQGIRGTHGKHEADAKDAIGDLMIFLLDFCGKKGWDAETILDDTWAVVRMRQWGANREHA